MKIRKIDTNGDIHFGYGDADFVSDSAQTVAQKVVQRLRLWEGEWFLDVTAGTPWKTRVLGAKFKKNVVQIIKNRIEKTEGVLKVDSIDVSFDPNTRKMKVTAKIQTIYGGTVVSVGGEPSPDVPTPTPPPPPIDLRSGITHHWAFGDGGAWDGASSVPSDENTITKGPYYSADASGIVGGCAKNTNVNTSGTGVTKQVSGIGTTDYTAAIWLNRPSSSSQLANSENVILSAATISGTNEWFGIGLSRNGTTNQVPAFGFGYSSLLFSLKGTKSVSNDTWHLIVLTIEASKQLVTLYCDGIAVDSKEEPIQLINGTSATMRCGLGRVISVAQIARSFVGLVDEFSIWENRALNESEILALWNEGKGLPFEAWT